MAQQLPTVFGQMPPFGQVAQLVQPILVNASHQQMAEPFCVDGTNNLQFLNGCVSALGQPLPPLCLKVVSIDHRPAQPTPAGPLAVTNCVLRTGDGHRVEASGWQAHAGALAALCVGTAYWFTNCVTRAKYQRLDCWYRIGVGGPNALVVPHVAPESSANISPMVPVQVGAGRDAVRVPTNVTNAGDEQRVDADLDNNNNDNHGLESRPSRCASRTAVARPTQRRAAEPAGRPIGECFVIERSTAMRNVPRNTRGEICELRFLPLEEAQRLDLLMEAIVQQLLDRVLAGHPRPSMVGLQLHPPGFDRPYVIGLRPPEQNNAAALAAAIERLNEQSAAGIDLLAGTTVTKVLAVWPLESIRADPQRGGACDRDVEHHVSNNVQSLVRIHNPNDRLCLARAVLLGMHDRETRMAGGGGKAAFNLFASRQDQHGPAAAQMLTRAGIAANRDMYTLDEVQRLQQWLNNQHGVGQIRLAVFEKEQEYRIVFKGDGLAARFNLCLVLERGHFNYIGRVEQLFDVPNYCIDCERRADARYHAFGCKVVCRLCLRYRMVEVVLESALNVSSSSQMVGATTTISATTLQLRWTAVVSDNVGPSVNGAGCVVRVDVLPTWPHISAHVTSQPTMESVGAAMGPTPSIGAPAFNQRRFFFHSFDNDGNDPLDKFLDFLLQHGPKKAHTVCIAHNGGKYDFHLVLEALHRRNRPPKHLCTTGLKIYSMRLSGRNQRRITFKDSINYFFCALDALVKSFQVPDHLATVKPFFPYLYIRRQHLSQRLNGLPAQEFYAPDTMKTEKRAQFLCWHADNNCNGFQLREQHHVLRQRRGHFEGVGLDPFLHASTAAGLALATFRRCFLPANRLVHSPEGGYLRGRRASAESQRYIRFFELEHPEAPNSLWGKLAQRVGQTEIRYTRTPAEFHALLDDPTVDKLDFVHVSDHMDRCVVRKRPEFARAPPTNCLPVAAFVTSYGRLHLYDYMEQVSAIDGAELLYCDTDSIYYVNKMGGPCVAEGEALGQMKRELTDRRIVEFVAGGPKNYGIRHTARDGTDERANLKIRSFRLSYTAQQLLTFEAMKDLTLATYNIDGPIDDALDNDDLYVYGGGEHRAIRVNFPQIDRNVYADLYTHEAHKDYRPFYAKGRVRPGMQTRPFGYLEDDGQPNEGQRTHRRKRNFARDSIRQFTTKCWENCWVIDTTQRVLKSLHTDSLGEGLNTDIVDHTQLVDSKRDALGVLDAPQNACRHFTHTAWVGHSGEDHTRRLEDECGHSFARCCTDAHDDSVEAPRVVLGVCATLRNFQKLLSS
ncbi:hypothetical protein niasHT_010950 [Heterodera trifolii]|uniref:DNA-directed DNA polymerase n=1 Tax=Heterodera trifolii TaxID=157864 RepID=A0ABD2LG21_9BILA